MGNLTATQKQEIRNEYANEDFNLLKGESAMAITGTKYGVITLTNEENVFKAFNRMGEELISTKVDSIMIDFISGSYTFEA